MKRYLSLQLMPLYAAAALSALGGMLLDFSLPDAGIWLLALPGTAFILHASFGQGFWRGALIGLVGAGFFFGSHIEWLTLYLGPLPWIGLTGYMAVTTALSLGVIGWVTRNWLATGSMLRFSPLVLSALIASVWTSREIITNVAPYGGFAWARIGLTQPDSPFASLASWVGISGLSWFVVALCALPVALYWQRTLPTTLLNTRPRFGVSRWVSHAHRPVLHWATAMVVAALLPAWGMAAMLLTPEPETIRVAAVQGNANAGLHANVTPGEITNNHLAVAEQIVNEEFDLMVWPENASDLNPLYHDDVREKFTELVDEMDAPLIFGTISVRGEDVFNSLIQWDPGVGPVADYDKRYPVPFAEYMPHREFYRALAPDLVDMVTRGYTFGTKQGNFKVPGANAGLLICFEITKDSLIRDIVSDGGAQVILSPTNNADFGYSDESAQQLGIARMQAIVSGRDLLQISTVGESAFIRSDGSILSEIPRYTPAYMIETMHLSDTITPAIRFGQWLEIMIVGFALFGLWCSVSARRLTAP